MFLKNTSVQPYHGYHGVPRLLLLPMPIYNHLLAIMTLIKDLTIYKDHKIA